MKFTFAPESRPLPGFTIKRAIYRGGFGEVYFGVSDAGREVALKLLHNNSDVEIRGVQQCLNLSHSNLVTIFDIVKDHDHDHWVVMEYISGETLDAAIRKFQNGMPVEVINKWLPGIVDGVSFLHQRGLVHRDLKPGNIFLQDGVVKIGDVGLSKFISSSQRSAQTQSVGTVYYMAPEVSKGSYGREVDVYALGVILYEMLTGDVPFDGESTGEILMKHLTAQPDLNRLPPVFRPVIAKALRKNPEERFHEAGELLTAFNAAVLGPRTNQQSASSDRHDDRNHHKQERSAAENWKQWSPEFAKTFTDVNDAVSSLEGRLCNSIQNEVAWWGRKWTKGQLVEVGILAIVLGVILGLIGIILAPIWLIVLPILLVLAPLLFVIFIAFYSEISSAMSRYFASPRPPNPIKADTAGDARNSAPVAVQVQSSPAQVKQLSTSTHLASMTAIATLIVPMTVLLSGILIAVKHSMFQQGSLQILDRSLVAMFVFTAITAGWGITLLQWVHPQGTRHAHSLLTKGLIGALVGVAAMQISAYLFVTFPESWEYRARGHWTMFGDLALMNGNSGPTTFGYVMFFGLFFALRNWSQVTSYHRSVRFSIWGVLKTIFVAWFITMMFAFPVGLAMVWAAVISSAVQLASPWHGNHKTQVMHS
ncbi:serine/threonine protein kinase [Planctomicrobium sp. SH527]|uniref:serine/threonine protein kinase n=1 Tax=Planctomicrobium sp. SH527 TaxID=3448123 RepID=UPI003F5C38D0